MVQVGRYRHFKGKDYDVIGVATETETGAQYVVYVSVDDRGKLWVRPLEMFVESVVHDGKLVPRFLLVASGKYYAGERLQPHEGTLSEVHVMVHQRNGATYELKHDQCQTEDRWPCHSPTGFNWGYNGSGPAELAKYILIDVFGREAILPKRGVTPLVRYQSFKAHFVARWGNTWKLSEDDIRAWAESERA